jgi:hypothetical protein
MRNEWFDPDHQQENALQEGGDLLPAYDALDYSASFLALTRAQLAVGQNTKHYITRIIYKL